MMDAVCRSCKSPVARPYCRKEGIDVFRCPACGYIYSGFEPDETAVLDHYARQYFEPYLTALRVHERERFSKRIREIRAFRPGGTLFDVGSGVGLFVKLAAQAGYRAIGADVSAWACEYARKRYKCDVFTGDFRDAGLGKGSCDVITLWHILEHVREPLDFMKDLNVLLKDDGLMALEVPNIDSGMASLAGMHWELMAPREHLSYFTPRTLERMLSSAGLKVIMRQTYFWTTPHMILSSRAVASSGFAKIFWKMMSLLVYPLSVIRFKTLPSFVRGDIMTVYAVKLEEPVR